MQTASLAGAVVWEHQRPKSWVTSPAPTPPRIAAAGGLTGLAGLPARVPARAPDQLWPPRAGLDRPDCLGSTPCPRRMRSSSAAPNTCWILVCRPRLNRPRPRLLRAGWRGRRRFDRAIDLFPSLFFESDFPSYIQIDRPSDPSFRSPRSHVP